MHQCLSPPLHSLTSCLRRGKDTSGSVQIRIISLNVVKDNGLRCRNQLNSNCSTKVGLDMHFFFLSKEN